MVIIYMYAFLYIYICIVICNYYKFLTQTLLPEKHVLNYIEVVSGVNV